MAYGRAALSLKRVLFSFIAGFLATLIFHQLTLAALWAAGMAPARPFSTDAAQPFGVPAVLSLAFLGGVWGIIYGLIDGSFLHRGYWVINGAWVSERGCCLEHYRIGSANRTTHKLDLTKRRQINWTGRFMHIGRRENLSSGAGANISTEAT